MPSGGKHTHHISLEESEQLDLGSDPYGYGEEISQEFDDKLHVAQQQLETLQKQREDLERQKAELEDLNRRKQEFINGQIEIGEKLSASVTSIDRELFEMRQEVEDLEQTRQAFSAHLERVEGIEPEAWPREMLQQELSRAFAVIDQAEDEYETAVSHFSGGRSRGLFGGGLVTTRSKSTGSSEFTTTLKNGFAFNLPVILLGSTALLVYLLK